MAFTNRLDNDILTVSIADPTSLDQLKSKIMQVETGVMDYMIQHVDDDGWKNWKPPQLSI
jgi:hypothetical protein